MQFEKIKTVEWGYLTLSIAALGLAVIGYELEFEEKMQREATIILYMILVFSIALVFLTIVRYLLTLQLDKKRDFGLQSKTLFSGDYFIPMCIEIFFVMLIPYPWLIGKQVQAETLNGSHIIYYHYNEIIQLFSALRVLVFIRVLLLSSIWNSNRCQRLCKIYGVQSGALFALKAIVATRPGLVIGLTYVFSIPYFGYMLTLAERPTNRLPHNRMIYTYPNAMWNIMEAMTVVGFGDFYPMTLLGRMIISIVAIWGTIVLSLFVVSVTQILDMDSLEQKVFLVLNRLRVKKRLMIEAANLIASWFRLRFFSRSANSVPSQMKFKFRSYFDSFQKTAREYRDLATSTDDIQEMNRQFKLVQRRMSLVTKQFKVIARTNKLFAETTRAKFKERGAMKMSAHMKSNKESQEEDRDQSSFASSQTIFY